MKYLYDECIALEKTMGYSGWGVSQLPLLKGVVLCSTVSIHHGSLIQ